MRFTCNSAYWPKTPNSIIYHCNYKRSSPVLKEDLSSDDNMPAEMVELVDCAAVVDHVKDKDAILTETDTQRGCTHNTQTAL